MAQLTRYGLLPGDIPIYNQLDCEYVIESNYVQTKTGDTRYAPLGRKPVMNELAYAQSLHDEGKIFIRPRGYTLQKNSNTCATDAEELVTITITATGSSTPGTNGFVQLGMVPNLFGFVPATEVAADESVTITGTLGEKSLTGFNDMMKNGTFLPTHLHFHSKEQDKAYGKNPQIKGFHPNGQQMGGKELIYSLQSNKNLQNEVREFEGEALQGLHFKGNNFLCVPIFSETSVTITIEGYWKRF